MSPPIPVAEAHARLMALFAPLGTEVVPLAEAAGRVLAADVVAERDQPPFPASAMDGYAVTAADVRPGATLRVVGVAAAGAAYEGVLRAGEAVRIFTGAPVPEGAGFVVIQEVVERLGETIILGDPGDEPAIRARAGDFARGDRLTAPRRLRPGETLLAAAMGAGRVTVARRPSIALVATGDELVAPGEPVGPDQIPSSNGHGLKALLDAAGAEAHILPIARDRPESLLAVLALARDADLIVTIGGASVGDHDLVRATAEGAGLDLAFHRVAIRPGKPLLAGRFGATPLIGLPGNPVSAMVCSRLFLLPAVERMLGLPGAVPEPLPARLTVDLGANGNRTHYMRARTVAGPDGWLSTPFARQDSSLVSILAEADSLLVRPPDDPPRPAGDTVEFIWL